MNVDPNSNSTKLSHSEPGESEPGEIAMATTAEHQTATNHARFCPQCGHLTGEGRFCPGCGQAIDTPAGMSAATAVQPPLTPPGPHASNPPSSNPPSSNPPSGAPPSNTPSRFRAVLIAAGGALGLVAIALAAIIVVSGSGSNANAVYHQKLTGALAPVLAANTTLSSSLQSLSGTDTTTAKNAAIQAQTAVVGARGAVAVLTVPSASAQLSQQVQQALTQESGYLHAVSATLSNPTTGNASQLQPLATSASSALVPLGGVAPGIGVSLSGTDALNSWASGRVAAAARASAAAATASRRAQQRTVDQAASAAQQASSAAQQAASASSSGSAASASSSGTDCGNGLHAGPNTSCPFAQSVQAAWEAAPGTTNTVQASSPVTGLTYTMNCSPAGSGITCSGGNNASVSW
jgi:hypothetical protein